MLDRIRASLPALPPAEQRVAKLLLADPAASPLPVAELAERAHVSKPTVVRFCRSVGYDGLADFKLKLAGTVNEGVPFVHRAVDEDDKPGDVVVKVIDNAWRPAEVPQPGRRPRGGAAIEALAQAVQQGRRIEFYGVGNSGIVAQDAQHKFFRLGVHACAVQRRPHAGDGRHHAGSGRLRGDRQQRGRSRDLIDAAEVARRKGATTIVITSQRHRAGAGMPAGRAGRRPPRRLRPLQPDGQRGCCTW
jgi:RpiR family carbohydrate utilization transcriptional regulator